MNGCISIAVRDVRRSGAVRAVAALSVCALLAGCGGGARQDAGEPSAGYPVQVTAAGFPSAQTLSAHTRMVIAVRNAGTATIPNLTVTVCPVTCASPAPPGQGTSSAVFGSNVGPESLDNPATPPWLLDVAPGPCGYSCQSGGAGAYSTTHSNTWASGALRPGSTAVFTWHLTAVKAGRYVVAWQIAGGLNGKAKAVLLVGGVPHGTFAVSVSGKPSQAYVTNSGKIVTTP